MVNASPLGTSAVSRRSHLPRVSLIVNAACHQSSRSLGGSRADPKPQLTILEAASPRDRLKGSVSLGAALALGRVRHVMNTRTSDRSVETVKFHVQLSNGQTMAVLIIGLFQKKKVEMLR